MYRPYLRRVEGGEMLIIVQTGKPIAEIKLVVGPPQGVRPFGLCAGECTVPEDFRCALTRGRH